MAHNHAGACQDKYCGGQGGGLEPVFDIKCPEFQTDDFRIFDFKVKQCPRTRAHDWTQCPFAHPGEKARRRDPRKFKYSAIPCPEYRKGSCKRGDACEFAHGVFECWLHPTRYRTQMCTDGASCNRLVCFFAHHESELRLPNDACLPVPSAVQQNVQPQIPEKIVDDPLFSMALAHLLAMQGQPQLMMAQTGARQAFPSGMMAQPANMNALLAQAQDIQQQILTQRQQQQQQQAQMSGQPQGVPLGAPMQHGHEMQQHRAPHLGIPIAMGQARAMPVEAGGYVNMHAPGTPSKQVAGTPYYPLSPTSPVEMGYRSHGESGSSSEASPTSSRSGSFAMGHVATALQETGVGPIVGPSQPGMGALSPMPTLNRQNSMQAALKQHQQRQQASLFMGQQSLPGHSSSRLHAQAESFHQQQGTQSMGQVGKCGSLDNLLQSLPRSLSDVGLADIAGASPNSGMHLVKS